MDDCDKPLEASPDRLLEQLASLHAMMNAGVLPGTDIHHTLTATIFPRWYPLYTLP